MTKRGRPLTESPRFAVIVFDFPASPSLPLGPGHTNVCQRISETVFHRLSQSHPTNLFIFFLLKRPSSSSSSHPLPPCQMVLPANQATSGRLFQLYFTHTQTCTHLDSVLDKGDAGGGGGKVCMCVFEKSERL